jgi:hypothetical protein
VSLDVAAVTHGYDQHGNLVRLEKKAKTKHLPKNEDSAADVRTGKKWEANHRKNATQPFKTTHYAERDRAMWLRGQGESVPKLPRTAHVPTVPLTRNPAGWGRSATGNLAGDWGPDGKYRVFPQGVNKPCTCKSCKASRKARV